MKLLICLLIIGLSGCAAICEKLPELDIDLNPLCVTPTPTPEYIVID